MIITVLGRICLNILLFEDGCFFSFSEQDSFSVKKDKKTPYVIEYFTWNN